MAIHIFTDLIPKSIPTRDGYRVVATMGFPVEEATVAYFLVTGSTVDVGTTPTVRNHRCWEDAKEAANTFARTVGDAIGAPAVV